MPLDRTFGALAIVGVLGCHWYGADAERRLGDSISLGGRTLEIRRHLRATGINLKGDRQSWCVSTEIEVVGDGKPRPPDGHHRGLCGECWAYPEISKDEASAAAKALYEKDPIIEQCVDTEAGILAAACLEDNPESPVWLIVHASKERVVWGDNVKIATCAEALKSAAAPH